jgi:hypothetical protein
VIGVLAGLGVGLPVLYFLEPLVLDPVVSPQAGQTIEDWLREFRQLETLLVILSVAVGLLWHASTFLDAGRSGDLRLVWVGLGILFLAFACWMAVRRLPSVQEGSSGIMLCVAVNALLPYYMASAAFTVASHKYAPWGSRALRKLW